MKASTIAVIIVSILVGAVSIAYYFEFVVPEREIVQRCAGYAPNYMDFLECHGVISITDGWDMDYLSLTDHVHKYEVARIYDLKQYIHTDEKIYVINRNTIPRSSSNGSRTLYYQKLFQNGKVVENDYLSISEIPTYLVIDYKSGEVRTYRNIEEVPDAEGSFFAELEKVPN
jgi:hypothetical protein